MSTNLSGGIEVYSAPGELTSPQWARAFVAGYPGKAIIRTSPVKPSGPFALFGSPRYETIVNQAETDFLFADHGFFGRGDYYRCARNARMVMGTEGDDSPARFRSFRIPVKDWRKRGAHIVLCPNSPAFMQRHGASNWVTETFAELKKYTNRPIRVRHKKDRRRLSSDLANAWAVVTFQSNAAVESVLAGIPVFCSRPCAALTMGCNDLSMIEKPLMPDGREQWAARLANKQWTLNEIARGQLWAGMQC